MEQEAFSTSVRKFLKMVGVRSQQEIEQAVQKALASGAIHGNESLPATMTLKIAGLRLDITLDGHIDLQ